MVSSVLLNFASLQPFRIGNCHFHVLNSRKGYCIWRDHFQYGIRPVCLQCDSYKFLGHLLRSCATWSFDWRLDFNSGLGDNAAAWKKIGSQFQSTPWTYSKTQYTNPYTQHVFTASRWINRYSHTTLDRECWHDSAYHLRYSRLHSTRWF